MIALFFLLGNCLLSFLFVVFYHRIFIYFILECIFETVNLWFFDIAAEFIFVCLYVLKEEWKVEGVEVLIFYLLDRLCSYIFQISL